MRRLLLFLTISSTAYFNLFSQSILLEKARKQAQNSSPVWVDNVYKATDNYIPYAPQHSKYLKTSSNKTASGGDLTGTVIGTTTYDVQTNEATPDRITVTSDGKVSATWTGSSTTTQGWNDRGTYYNFYDGSTWGNAPSQSIETPLRTGWPANVLLEGSGKEVNFSHDPGPTDPTPGGDTLVVYRKDHIGFPATWTQVIPDTTLSGIWPRAIAGNGDTIHLINSNFCGTTGGSSPMNNCNGYLQYWRSPDAGSTWDIRKINMPGSDTATGILRMPSDAYSIDAQDSTVVITLGGVAFGWRIWVSNDYGNSWTQTIIIDTPGINSIFIPSTNPVFTSDGSVDVLIDKNGIVHAWSGSYLVTDPDSSAGTGYSFFPSQSYLLYWNSTYGADSANAIATALDLDGDTLLTGLAIFQPASPAIYGGAAYALSMPAASIDPTSGNIYVLYSASVEYTDVNGDPASSGAQSYRDIYGIYTTDNGSNWSFPANLTNSADDNYENVFISAARNTNGNKVHATWMRDDEPGVSLPAPNGDGDPIKFSDMIYQAFEYSEFELEKPIANFTYSYPGYGGKVDFFDSSANFPNQWLWEFNDSKPNVEYNSYQTYNNKVSHTFVANGTYNVCLTVTRNYQDLFGNSYFADSQICQMVTIEKVGIADRSISNILSIYPNPTNGLLTVDFGNYLTNTEGLVTVKNILGQTLETNQLNITTSKYNLDMTNYDSGIYFIEVVVDGETVTKKVTVAK